jgi:hypothetical protein
MISVREKLDFLIRCRLISYFSGLRENKGKEIRHSSDEERKRGMIDKGREEIVPR